MDAADGLADGATDGATDRAGRAGAPAPSAFLGRWTIRRRIADRLGGDARFEGTASVTAAGDHWLYDEAGEMRLADGAAFRAHRRYLWVPAAGAIEVRFDDGRPFHRIPLAGGEDSHLCVRDLYAVSYDFSAWPEWRAVWRVRGPRKDYTMTSRYAPLAEPEPGRLHPVEH